MGVKEMAGVSGHEKQETGNRKQETVSVLGEYFQGRLTVEKICERFGITAGQMYKWLNLWRTQKTEWLRVLNVEESSDQCFLCSIFQVSLYSDFAFWFVRLFAKSFLQSHKNPAVHQQEVLDG